MRCIVFLIPILLLFSCEKEENLIEQNLIEFLKGKVYQKDIPEGKRYVKFDLSVLQEDDTVNLELGLNSRGKQYEGWVYYVDDTHLTIEISVKPKEDDLVPMHRKHHCLVVVQSFEYDELVYVNSRRYSNASNLDDMEIYVRKFDDVDTYKSQPYRHKDP